jgi:hypothetical protein
MQHMATLRIGKKQYSRPARREPKKQQKTSLTMIKDTLTTSFFRYTKAIGSARQ